MIKLLFVLVAIIFLLVFAFSSTMKKLDKERVKNRELEKFNNALNQERKMLRAAQVKNAQNRARVEKEVREGKRDYFESN